MFRGRHESFEEFIKESISSPFKYYTRLLPLFLINEKISRNPCNREIIYEVNARFVREKGKFEITTDPNETTCSLSLRVVGFLERIILENSGTFSGVFLGDKFLYLRKKNLQISF